MADYWVYSGASGAGTSWADAFASWAAAQTALGGNLGANRFFVADDHVDATTGANKTHVGPTSGLPCVIISSDRSDTGAVPAYKVGTTNQFNTSDGNFTLTFDGSFALYGVKVASGGTGAAAISFASDQDEYTYTQNCTLAPGASGRISLAAVGTSATHLNLHIDLTADGTSARTGAAVDVIAGNCRINGLTFTNPGYRTGTIFTVTSGANASEISSADLSGFTNATTCEIVNGPDTSGTVTFIGCKTKSSPTYCSAPTTGRAGGTVTFINTAATDDPSQLYVTRTNGTLQSSTSIYRGSGASIEDVTTVSWGITTTAECSEQTPFYTPWIYGTTTNGTKTFDVYIAQDGGAGDLTDADIWLDVEAMGTADSPLYSLASDHRTINAAAVAQTDDTGSSWTGITATYKQKLSCAAVTVGESGLYRARVAVGKASATVYVDPRVVIS